MDRLIDLIYEDIKYIKAKTDELAETSAANNERIKDFTKRITTIEEDLEPIKSHVAIVGALGKIAFILLSGGASIAAILRVLKGMP